jgi:predicted nucleotidyltransferase
MKLTSSQVQNITHYLQQQGVLAAWVYGSYAQCTANQQRDIDLAVLLSETQDDWLTLPELDHELSQRMGIEVNTLSIAKAPTPLAWETVEGVRLFGASCAMLMEQRVWSKWDEWNYWREQA